NQCLSANWVGCAMGCGMGLLNTSMPVCWDALQSLMVTPEKAGYMGATVGPKELVCAKNAPESCKRAEEAVRSAFINKALAK
ncbi:MAG: hypothetical protein WCO84_10080, partial [bacterium]